MTKTGNSITIRPARKEDAAEIARLIVVPWPVEAFMSQEKGRTVEDLMKLVEMAVRAEDTLYSYENTLVAVTHHRTEKPIVGILTGYDGAELHRLRRPVEKIFMRRNAPGTEPDKTDSHGATPDDAENVVVEWEDETRAGEFYLDTLSVSPGYQRHGIGTALIEAMCKRAANLGHDTAGLLVDFDNPSAERLYLRLGFKMMDEVSFMGHRMKHLQKAVTL